VRRYGLIYNPRSGDGHRSSLLAGSGGRLRAEGHEVFEYAVEADPGEATKTALRNGCDVVVACGGDGTVSAVANALWHPSEAPACGAVLGVLPFGTLNHFAKDLGINSVEQAESVLLGDHVREIDAAVVNGRLFVNNSGIGIYPMMVLQRERVQKAGLPKWPAFFIACIRTLFKMPFQHLDLEAEGARLAQTTPFLFVGNNEYTVEGKSLGRRKHLDKGVLGVYMARRVTPLGLFRMAVRAVMGTVRQDRDFTAFTAQKLTVRRRQKRAIPVSLDGEVCRMKPPLEYSAAPRALRVLVP
jgi:diacylglycerol kinase family enzyme